MISMSALHILDSDFLDDLRVYSAEGFTYKGSVLNLFLLRFLLLKAASKT